MFTYFRHIIFPWEGVYEDNPLFSSAQFGGQGEKSKVQQLGIMTIAWE
jgi:hypothetical protein